MNKFWQKHPALLSHMLCNANVYFFMLCHVANIVSCCSCKHTHTHTHTNTHHHTQPLSPTLMPIRHQRNSHLRDATNLKTIEDFKTAAAAAAQEAKAERERMKGEYVAHVGDLTTAVEMR